jgi:hypothetical protein
VSKRNLQKFLALTGERPQSTSGYIAMFRAGVLPDEAASHIYALLSTE